ncbi:amino acid transporter arg-13 [Hyaloraphidium curvatum]|nr:amino acid transporter arg-13 [Hyaloraphidium curvatum]
MSAVEADALVALAPPAEAAKVKTPAPKDSALLDFVFGSIAGITGKVIEFPFDTVKVRLQTAPTFDGRPAYSGTVDCFLKTVGAEGPLALYKGLLSPLLGSMMENAILFSAYNGIQNGFRRLDGTYDPDPAAKPSPLSNTKIAFAAAGAGAAVSLVLTPVELVKCKLQVQDMLGAEGPGALAPRYKGPVDVLLRTLRSEGLRGMYRGQTGTLIREAGGGVAWFGVYELVVAWMMARDRVSSKDDLSPVQIMVAGALAGMAFNGSVFPADTIKSKMQTDDLLGNGSKHGFWSTGRQIWRGEGIRGFYKGLGITLFRSMPASGGIFLTYELLRRNVVF